MNKVTIEITDIEGGKVQIKATPNFEDMMKRDLSGSKLTPAHGYALALLNLALEISKANRPGSEMVVRIPKILRPYS